MNTRRENGFSLVEVLASVLVLAIGVIGAAGMQLAAMRTSQQVVFQDTALQIAGEMADAIRARHRKVAGQQDAHPFLRLDYQSSGADLLPVPDKLCYANICDEEEFLAFEIYEWKRRVQTGLPGGRVRICRDAAPWSSAGKVLSWECSDDLESGAPVVIKLGWQAKSPDGSLIRDVNNNFPPSVALAVGFSS